MAVLFYQTIEFLTINFSNINTSLEHSFKLYKSNDKKFGYNLNEGGDNNIGSNNGRSILTENDIIDIRVMRSKFKNRDEVYESYIDRISKIWFCRYMTRKTMTTYNC